MASLIAGEATSPPSAALRQLSADRGVPMPTLKRELSQEGMKLLKKAYK